MASRLDLEKTVMLGHIAKMASHQSKAVIYAALAGNTAIAVVKFGAALYTGSAAMFAESVHSVVDTGNQGLLLFGLRRAARPADARHPFGHGLQLYFFTFVVAVMIFGVGAVVSISHGIDKVIHPRAVEAAWVNYVVLGFSMVFEGIVWVYALRAFNTERAGRPWLRAIRLSKDPTVFTVLFEDTAALIGLLVALFGVFASAVLQTPIFDGIASILVGVILAVTAIFLGIESQSLLTGESASRSTREGIDRIAKAEPGVVGLNEALTMHFGPNDIFVALSLEFRDALPAVDVERAVTRIERAIKRHYPDVSRVFVEAQSLAADRRGGRSRTIAKVG